MLISYYEDGTVAPRRIPVVLVGLMATNSLFAFAILFAWTYVALLVSEPLSWATWMPISRGQGLLGALEYPFVILWLLPLIGSFGGWVGIKGGRTTLAYAFVGVPLAMLLLVFGWYYLTPADWR
jgi:hypothetical protein